MALIGVQDRDHAKGSLGDDVPHLRGNLLAQCWRAGNFEEQPPAGVLGQAHGEPAHESHLDVVDDFEAELADVEVQRERPTTCANARLKVPRLWKPTG